MMRIRQGRNLGIPTYGELKSRLAVVNQNYGLRLFKYTASIYSQRLLSSLESCNEAKNSILAWTTVIANMYAYHESAH